MSRQQRVQGERSRSRVRSVAAGAVLGGGGFAAASMAGVAGLHLLGQTAGLQARADDDPKIWVDNSGGTAGPHHAGHRKLDCAGIDLWGDDVDHRAGGYRVVSEGPASHERSVLTGTWQFAPKQDGPQVMATLQGSDLVSAAQAAGAVPNPTKGYRFAIRVRHADGDHERHFWVAACPAVAPPPVTAPPPTGGVAAAQATRPPAVPSTGVGGDDVAGVTLIALGGGCLGAAAGMRRGRRPRDLCAAGPVSAAETTTEIPAGARARSRRAHALGLSTVDRRLALAALATMTLTGIVAGPARAATVSAARGLATSVERLVVPATPPVRLIPVDVWPNGAAPATVDPDITQLIYAFPPAAERR